MKALLKSTTRLLGVTLATAVLGASAIAGDGYGTKDGYGGIPVPAPIPVADYAAQYYFRVDAAYGWNDASSYSTTYANANLGYPDAIRFDEGFSEFGRYGIGAGMYFNSYLRADVTFDIRNEVEGRVLSTEQVAGDNGTTWTRTTEDHIVSRDNTILANVYVDIPAWARFRPYIGAGAGVAVHRMHRTYGLRVDCTVIPVPGTDCFNGNGPIIDGQGNLATADAREKDWQFGFAGALMAGGVVDLSENWKLDVGYRFLHLTSVGFSHPISGTQVGAPVATTGTVKIPDQNIHEFRVGLRYDIY